MNRGIGMIKIKLINVGGTITTDVSDSKKGELLAGELTGEDLIKRSGLDKLPIDISIENLLSIGSRAMTLDNMKELGRRIEEISKEGIFSGVVITHGTDTMEETAYFLDLMLEPDIPVVITGSQRIIRDLGFDGSSNLRDAILVASSEESRNKGVLVVFNQRIFPAEYVMKSNSTNIDGFSCPGTGPIGVTHGGQVTYYYEMPIGKKIKISDQIADKVCLFKLTADFPAEIIDFAVEKDYKGLIIEAFGVGNVPPSLQDVIEKAIEKGIWVVLTTRCLVGGVRPVYGHKGGGTELEKLGIIFDNILTGPKARIKLTMLLSSPDSKDIDKVWSLY